VIKTCRNGTVSSDWRSEAGGPKPKIPILKIIFRFYVFAGASPNTRSVTVSPSNTKLKHMHGTETFNLGVNEDRVVYLLANALKTSTHALDFDSCELLLSITWCTVNYIN
jgi:hypothetical protein